MVFKSLDLLVFLFFPESTAVLRNTIKRKGKKNQLEGLENH